jgi:hypothetical protein
MQRLRIIPIVAIFLYTVPFLYAIPVEEKTSDEILKEVRLSRIPQIIETLEEKGTRALEAERFPEAKAHFQKALVLKHAIGMKHTEGSAQILAKVSKIENKLGNHCEATKLSKLAQRIYRQIGLNFGAVSFEEVQKPKEAAQVTCVETITWLKD